MRARSIVPAAGLALLRVEFPDPADAVAGARYCDAAPAGDTRLVGDAGP